MKDPQLQRAGLEGTTRQRLHTRAQRAKHKAAAPAPTWMRRVKTGVLARRAPCSCFPMPSAGGEGATAKWPRAPSSRRSPSRAAAALSQGRSRAHPRRRRSPNPHAGTQVGGKLSSCSPLRSQDERERQDPNPQADSGSPAPTPQQGRSGPLSLWVPGHVGGSTSPVQHGGPPGRTRQGDVAHPRAHGHQKLALKEPPLQGVSPAPPRLHAGPGHAAVAGAGPQG